MQLKVVERCWNPITGTVTICHKRHLWESASFYINLDAGWMLAGCSILGFFATKECRACLCRPNPKTSLELSSCKRHTKLVLVPRQTSACFWTWCVRSSSKQGFTSSASGVGWPYQEKESRACAQKNVLFGGIGHPFFSSDGLRQKFGIWPQREDWIRNLPASSTPEL